MALMCTLTWAEVAEVLLSDNGGSDPQALCRQDVLRTLIVRLRAADFRYTVYPAAHGDEPGRLELYPSRAYDFDCGFGRGMWFDVRTDEREVWSRGVRPNVRQAYAGVTVTHIAHNDRLETYEKRSWEVPPKFLFNRLAAFFEEVSWPVTDPRTSN